MSPDEAQRRSGRRLRDVLLGKLNDPPGKTWRVLDDRNNFGPAFFEVSTRGKR